MSLVSSRRPALAAGLVSLSLAGVAAVPATASNYPKKVDRAFLTSCEKSAVKAGASRGTSRTYCKTVLHCLESKLTLKQFIAVDRNVSKGHYSKVANACIKKGKQAIS
jgi:hypothetical protein